MSNLKIREFQQAIINFTNQSELPVEVKRLCFEEILTQLRDASNQELQKEVMRREAEEKEKAEKAAAAAENKESEVK